jgi:hypothetical protein
VEEIGAVSLSPNKKTGASSIQLEPRAPPPAAGRAALAAAAWLLVYLPDP